MTASLGLREDHVLVHDVHDGGKDRPAHVDGQEALGPDGVPQASALSNKK